MWYLENRKYKSKTIHLYSATFFWFYSTQTWLLFYLKWFSRTCIRYRYSDSYFNRSFPSALSLSKEKGNIRSKGFWKFNSSLIKDQNYINENKDLIRNFDTKNDCAFSQQLKWEFLKYEIRKFTVHYTKSLAKERKQKVSNLESELKNLEISLDDANNLGKYNNIKN